MLLKKHTGTQSILLGMLFLLLISFVLAATNPLFVNPSPSNGDMVTGLVTLNFTFSGTTNWTVTADNGTVTELCAANNSVSSQTCVWNTTAFPEDTYDIALITTNASNASDFNNDTITSVEVEHPINPSFIPNSPSNNSNLSGTVVFNFTYSTRGDHNLYYSTGGGWTLITGTGCIGNNVDPPQSCTWDTTAVSDNANYTINLTAEDWNNATDTGEALLSGITVDNTNPALTLVAPDNSTNSSSSTVWFNWSVSDTIDTNTSCNLTIDASVNATYDASTNTTSRTMADGVHTWSVACSDYTGNVNTSETRSFTVDTVFPVFAEINITPRTADNFTNTNPALSLAVTEANLELCQYHIGDSSWVNLTISGTAPNRICSGTVANQTHGSLLNLTFRTIDIAGNTLLAPSNYNVTVDNTTPTVTLHTPVADLNLTDGSTFYVNASVSDTGSGLTDGVPCTTDIGGNTNSTTGAVLYNASTGYCAGNLTIKDPSELSQSTLRFTFNVFLDDRVNNTGTDNNDLLIDNLGPSVITKTTNATNNATTNETNALLFTMGVFDNSYVTSVIIGNDTNVSLTNTTVISKATIETFTGTTNASLLGCPSIGLCLVNIYINDSWGNVGTSTLNVVIDSDTPEYLVNGTNASGTIGLKEPVLIYAQWDDDSLSSEFSTTATLYKYDDASLTSASAIETIALNNSLSWSNFTYLAATTDEGKTLTFYISYTDFASRTNTTQNLSFGITNSTPQVRNITVLHRTQNISNETPTVSVSYFDSGAGIADANVTLSIYNGTGTRNFTKSGAWSCVTESNYNETSVSVGDWVNFTTSSYSITDYSFLVTAINHTGTNATSTVTLERANYGKTNETTLTGWSDSYSFEDITIRFDWSQNSTGTTVNLTFIDLQYTEYSCNYTLPAQAEGTYTATLYLRDSANNTNSSVFSWLIDGYRPIVRNLSLGDQFVIRNNVRLSDVVNVTQTSKVVDVNWTVNESNMERTNITIDGVLVYSDGSGATTNQTTVVLEPGYHFFQTRYSDILFTGSNSTEENATLYLDVVTNASALYQNLSGTLTTSLSPEGTLDGLVITHNDVIVNTNESTRLSGNVSLDASFSTSNTWFIVNASATNGLLYNWNNTDKASLDMQNTSTDVETFAGITVDWYARLSGYSPFGSAFEWFYSSPTPDQETTWQFNASNSSFVVLEGLTQQEYHLLTACSVTPSSTTTFADACYEVNGTNFTVYAPAWSGLAFGTDAGAPNISVTPAEGSVVNNSMMTLQLSVIEPSPNSTHFCDYDLRRDNVSLDSQSLPVSNFTLTGAAYVLDVNYEQLYSDTNYSVNVTCFDSEGNNASYIRNFSITDSVAPTILTTNETVTFVDEFTVGVSYDEWARFRVNYSSSSEFTLESQTNWTAFGTSATLDVQRLATDTRYYYRIEVCDINDQCTFYPSLGAYAESVRTAEATQSNRGGGGGGGITEGMTVASHFHGWSEIEEGRFSYTWDDELIAPYEFELFLTNKTHNAYFEIRSYYGKAPNVPRAQPIAYQYFNINHDGFDVAQDFVLRFRVPDEWLVERNATKVRLFRLESGNWSEYNVKEIAPGHLEQRYEAALPGFSFFVITVDGIEPVVSDTNNTNGTNTSNIITGNVPDPVIIPPDPGDTFDPGSDTGTVATYEPKKSLWWLWVLLILVVIVIGGGVYWYMQQQPVTESVVLDPQDPFYELQEYIHSALAHGHSPDDVREKLISVGWDDIVVDEELEKMMTSRVE